jgi:hypothetical protein
LDAAGRPGRRCGADADWIGGIAHIKNLQRARVIGAGVCLHCQIGVVACYAHVARPLVGAIGAHLEEVARIADVNDVQPVQRVRHIGVVPNDVDSHGEQIGGVCCHGHRIGWSAHIDYLQPSTPIGHVSVSAYYLHALGIRANCINTDAICIGRIANVNNLE